MTETLAGGLTAAEELRSPNGANPPAPERRLHRLTVATLIVGLIVTLILTGFSRLNYVRSENHLVKLEATLTADALAAAPTDIQRRLGRATAVTAATGDAKLFAETIASSIGGNGPFVGAELYQVVGGRARPVSSVGGDLLVPPGSTRAEGQVQAALRSSTFALDWLNLPGQQRFGYAMAVTAGSGTYVGYAEQVLPPNHRAPIPTASPVSNLNYAFYFGSVARPGNLIISNVAPPVPGTSKTVPVPFGDHTLTLVVSARTSLVGFGEYNAWIILAVGIVLTASAAVMSERLTRRRLAAERLSTQVTELYRQQRNLAEDLQRSLLPTHLPARSQIDISGRYMPGTAGLEVGGDWYDVVEPDDRHLFFTVGDVAGRGLGAASTMALLRHSINAHATDGDDPEVVLAKAGRLVDVMKDRFATAICGSLDLRNGSVVLANAGHVPPLVIEKGQARTVDTVVGAPVGVGHDYTPVTVQLAAGSTLLVVTDGLVERRGEPLSEGIDRLLAAASASDPIDQLLDRIIAQLAPDGSADDIAALGITWRG